MVKLTPAQKDMLLNDALTAISNKTRIEPDKVFYAPSNYEPFKSQYPNGSCCLVGAVALAAGCDFRDRWNREVGQFESIIVASNRLGLSLDKTDELAGNLDLWEEFEKTLGKKRFAILVKASNELDREILLPYVKNIFSNSKT